MKSFQFKLITPEKVAYDDSIESLTLMTESGQITVRADHEHLISVVVPGELVISKSGEQYPFVVGQGAITISHNHVEILANTTESVADIDEERAKEALERARTAMESQADMADVDYARIEALIARNLARVKIKGKY
jgi:F-type H+-transporting ATPase subunit epsilon